MPPSTISWPLEQHREKKQAIIDELSEMCFDALADEIGRQSGKAFDLRSGLPCRLGYAASHPQGAGGTGETQLPPATEQARRVLEALLDKYADEGVAHIEETDSHHCPPRIRHPMEIIRAFGGLNQYQQAVHDLERRCMLVSRESHTKARRRKDKEELSIVVGAYECMLRSGRVCWNLCMRQY